MMEVGESSLGSDVANNLGDGDSLSNFYSLTDDKDFFTGDEGFNTANLDSTSNWDWLELFGENSATCTVESQNPETRMEVQNPETSPVGSVELQNPETRMEFLNTETSPVGPSGISECATLSDRLKDEILGRISMCKSNATLCPPILAPHPSSTNVGESGDVTDLDLSKGFLVARSEGLFCVNIGIQAGSASEKLVIYNPTTTSEKFIVLPPDLFHVHPVVMHLRVNDCGDYTVLIAGSLIGENPSVITQEYSSTTGGWICTGILQYPSFGFYEYQNGVYFTDSERELHLCTAIVDMKLGTKGTLMYDYKKKQWVEGPIIPLVQGKSPEVISSIVTAHIVGCNGSLFVYSKEECEQDVYFCIHKLNLDKTEDDMWEQVFLEKRTRDQSSVLAYPEDTRVLFTDQVTLIAESGIMFSTQKKGKDAFICIHKLKPSPDGSESAGTWEKAWPPKTKRHRSPDWRVEEITAYLKLREEGLGKFKGKDHWDNIALQLKEKYNIIGRDSKACEDLWGTLLKRHTEIQTDLRRENIHPDTSEWDNYWKMDGNEKSKNKFGKEFYEGMNRILSTKPRRKAGARKKLEKDVYVAELEGEVAELKGEVAELKEEVAELKELKEKLRTMEATTSQSAPGAFQHPGGQMLVSVPLSKTQTPCNSKRSKSGATKEGRAKKRMKLKAAVSASTVVVMGLIYVGMFFGSIDQGFNGSNGIDDYTLEGGVRAGARKLESINGSNGVDNYKRVEDYAQATILPTSSISSADINPRQYIPLPNLSILYHFLVGLLHQFSKDFWWGFIDCSFLISCIPFLVAKIKEGISVMKCSFRQAFGKAITMEVLSKSPKGEASDDVYELGIAELKEELRTMAATPSQLAPDITSAYTKIKNLLELDDYPEHKKALEEWYRRIADLSNRVSRREARSSDVTNQIYNIIGLFAMFLGVVLTAVLQLTQTQGIGAGMPPNAPPPPAPVRVVAPAAQIAAGPGAAAFDVYEGLAVGSPPKHSNPKWNIPLKVDDEDHP